MSTLVKCVNGHFYDADKSRDCPYCRSIAEERKRISVRLSDHPVVSADDEGIGESVTQAMPAGDGGSTFLPGGGPMRQEGPGVDDDGATISPDGLSEPTGSSRAGTTGSITASAGWEGVITRTSSFTRMPASRNGSSAALCTTAGATTFSCFRGRGQRRI